MGENSEISWTHHTQNWWIGCTALSAACDHCYAEAMVKRFGGDFAMRRRTSPANWRKPLAWNRKAAALAERHRVFSNSLSDFFDNQAAPEWRAEAWSIIKATQHLDWLLLTKRPQNIAKMLPPDWGDGYPNVWLGTTAENQEEADRRIPHLLAVPARVRFLSCEPLLGPLDIAWSLSRNPIEIAAGFLQRGRFSPGLETLRPIDWVIAGGESGHHARPMHPDWLRSLRDQCAISTIPFHMKQWGEWLPGVVQFVQGELAGTGSWHAYHQDGTGSDNWGSRADHWWNDGFETQPPYRPGIISTRVGKKRAGRLIDGVLHDAFPKIAA